MNTASNSKLSCLATQGAQRITRDITDNFLVSKDDFDPLVSHLQIVSIL